MSEHTIGSILQAALDQPVRGGKMFDPAEHAGERLEVRFDLWITDEGRPHLSELRIGPAAPPQENGEPQ